MEEPKKQLVDRIHQAQNILVTVSNNPSVDQLAAAIGLTLALNKLDKHATAVFSGQVPNTLEFLKPQETLEKNTDSLRDFIIALDKAKADKLRYKVEDEVVRIFITPFRTSLSEKDLNFSQGDFNVDVVVCLGVKEQNDLDQAITAHGRILHDATIASLSNTEQGSLGSINWVDTGVSSLSEMAVSLLEGLDKKVIDNQIATALLTGIVASTDRFSNSKTSPRTMSASSTLMAAGADQQLIATKLEPLTDGDKFEHLPPQDGTPSGDNKPSERKAEPGTLEINHEDSEEPAPKPPEEPPQPQIKVDENGQLITNEPKDTLPKISQVKSGGSDFTPSSFSRDDRDEEDLPSGLMGGNLTANANPNDDDPASEELTLPPLDGPLLSHNQSVLTAPKPSEVVGTPSTTAASQQPLPPSPMSAPPTPPPIPTWEPPKQPAIPAPAPSPVSPSWAPPEPPAAPQPAPVAAPAPQPAQPAHDPSDLTLTDIERSVESAHLKDDVAPALSEAQSVNEARDAVEAAIKSAAGPETLEPIAALNAQPLGAELHGSTDVPNTEPTAAPTEALPGNTPADQTLDMPLPSNPFGPGQSAQAPPSFAPPAAATPPAAPPSAFPGAPQPSQATPGQTPPPPVPPPMLPPLQ